MSFVNCLPRHSRTLFFIVVLIISHTSLLAAGERVVSEKALSGHGAYSDDEYCSSSHSSEDERCGHSDKEETQCAKSHSSDDDCGESNPSDDDQVVQNLHCRAKNDKVVITWEKLDNAHRYQLNRHLSHGSELVGSVKRKKLIDKDLSYGVTYTYTVKALYKDGSKSEASSPCSVTPHPRSKNRNHAPEITSEPVLSANSGQTYQYDVEAKDSEGDNLTYRLALAPMGAVIDPQSGLIEWFPDYGVADKHIMTVVVEDSGGKSASQSWWLQVKMVNHQPVVTSTPVPSTIVGQQYSYDVEASDEDGDPLTYSLHIAPEGMSIDAQSGLIEWLPTSSQVGSHAIKILVSDGKTDPVKHAYYLQVEQPSNNAPTISSIAPLNAIIGQLYRYDIEALDPDGDTLSYALLSAPSGMTIDSINGVISWTPDAAMLGSHDVNLQVDDGQGGIATQAYTLVVALPPNTAPTITSSAPLSATVGQAYQYDVEATDPDGDVLLYQLASAPSGMTINESNGLIGWIPTSAQLGDHQVTVQVVDNESLRSTQEYTLTVIDRNNPPVAHTLSISTDEDNRVDINLQGEDPDNDSLTYVLVSQPANGQLSGDVPNLSYTPNTDYNGVDSFSYRVNDGALDSNPATVTITVNARNDAPSVQDLVIESAEDTDVSISLVGSDPENDTLTYTVLTQPTRGRLSGEAPSLTYTPDENFNGPDSFTYSANDGETDANSATVAIAVTAVNDTPVVVDSNVDLPPDQTSEIDLVAMDVDGDPLVYSIDTPTQFGAVSIQGPVVSYTPMPGFVGQDNFSYRVNDGQADALATITINVVETNHGPVIISEPAKLATRGHVYFYAVKAEDPESDQLTYRLITAPNGMAIDQDNGLIRWLPEREGEESVELEVSDSQGNTVHQNYVITVRPEQIDANYIGQAFSVMFNKQLVGNIDYLGNELHLFFASTSNNQTIVTVDIPGLGYSQELSVLPGSIGQLNLTDLAADLNFDELGIQSTGILVRSTEDISLTLLNFYQNSLDSALVLPDSALGTDYVITAYQSLKYSKIRSANLHSGEQNVFMGIVASQDDTDITITPKVDFFDGIAERTTGSPYTINLARGETYQVYSPSNLSGSRVSSSGPVSVFAGNSCAYIQELYCDHIVENLLPVDSWGSEYYVTPLALRENGDTFVVYAAYDNTVISLNGIYIAQLNQGEYLEFIEDRPSKLTGSKPFALAQYSNSLRYDQSESSNSMGDPAMLIVEPEDHFLSSYLVSTLPETIVLEGNIYTGPFRHNFVNLLADESIKDTITLNGEPINIDWQPIENSHYYGGSLPLDIGSYDISGAGIFGLYVYGFDNYDSYAHYGGSALTTNILPGAITLQRDGDQQLRAGDEVCAIASLIDNGGRPAVRAQAQFTLADAANGVEQNQTIVTDSAGQARACFANPFASSAVLIAQWGNLQQSMNVEWHNYDESVNRTPVIVSYPEFYATPNQAYSYQVIAADPNEDVLSYELTQAPTGMLIDNTGLISWSVPNDFHETVIVVQVSDGEFAVSQSYRLAVVLGLNRAPVFSSEPEFILRRSSTPSGLELLGNHSYYYSVEIFDPDYDQDIVYRVLQGPAGMTIRTDGVLSWTPGNEQQGEHQVILSIDDGFGGVNTQTFVVTVASDHIPELAEGIPLPQITVAQHTYSHRINVVDQDGDSLSYRLNNPPEGMTISNTIGSQGRIHWRPTDAQIGDHSIAISISDPAGNVLDVTYPISVIPNTGPVLNTPDTSIEFVYNQYNCFDFMVDDPEDDRLQHQMLTGPTGINFVSGNAYFRLCWQPAIGDVGDHLVEVQSTDDNGGELLTVINVHVLDEMIVQTVPGDQLLVLPATLSTAYRARHPESLSVSYSLQNAPNGMTIDSAGNIRWQPSISDIGTYVVNAIATAGDKTASTPFNVVVRQENEAPVVAEIPTQSIQVGRLFEYPVQATDSNNDVLNYRLAAGSPQGLTIDAQGLLRWTPTNSQEGSHTTSVIVEDGFGEQTPVPLNLQVVPFSNSMPVVNGPFPSRSVVGFLYEFNLNATDPDDDPLTYALLHTTPDGVTVDSQGTVRWAPTEEQVGASTFGVRVSDGFSYVEINWQVDIGAELMPLDVAASVSPQYIPLDGQTELAVVLNGGVNPIIDSITIDGNPLPVQAVHRYQLQGDSVGRHLIEITASDVQSGQSASISLFYAVGDSEDTSEPVITFVNPTENSTITAPVEVIGSVMDDNLAEWLLFYRRADADTYDYTVLATGTDNISEQVLATFDPSSLMNGIYQIVLQATDMNGNSGVTGVNVLVEGDLKLGNFSFTVEDLNLPMAGIPIRVTRTYDSRKKAERLGFGHGWTIDYQSVTVDETGEPSQGWERVQQSALFILDGNSAVFNASCLYPTTTKRIAITLPNGDVETFTVRANNISGGAQSVQDPNCYLFAGQYFNLEFVAEADTTSTLTSVDANNLLFNNASGNLTEITASDAVEITRYTLTTRTGYTYNLNQDFGIQSVTDPNGNTLTYGDSGIAHSSGKSIEFIRDTLGRITHLVDPAGNVINYQYDANGDLASVIKRDGAEVNYTYYGSNCSNISATADCHLLDDIRDPLGRRLLKNIYDANGRLIAQEDQSGNRTDFNHDVDGRQSVITDRNGNVTAYYYDDNGNITTQVDALGHTKTFTYDANGNQLSQTDELGNTTQATYNATNDQLTQTDALGNTLTYTYNDRGQETRITDARGNEYVNTYDARGNLSSLQDPEGNIVVSTTGAQGLVTSIVDSVGNTTSYTYDSDGNKLTETDQLGNITVFTYDDRNNVLTETRTRTVNGLSVDEVTAYVYDDRDRLIQTTDALGNITHIEYNLSGKESARIDGLGHRTELEYDAYGNLLETRYPDGTTETHTYDAENNKLSTTDRSSHVTRFEYDALNRLTRTIHPDGAVNSVEYDAAGRVSAEIDARGNRTTYEYDAVNRRTASIDALGNRHEFSYDEDGNLTAETDANGNTTAYAYNTLDQRTNTTYADGSSAAESHDALARVRQRVDQAGRRTDYTYDYSGRLTQVTDALGGTTSYSYDEQGNKLTQTDAENRTTSWRYDSLGRVLSRTLPMGQQETFAYDLNGNLTSHTDFNGATTTHRYDSDNRLIQSDYADGTTEVIDYDAVGNCSQVDVTRPGGSLETTLYTYDAGNRLETEVKPDGTVLSYQYDAAGNRTQVHIGLPDGSSQTTDYGYDSLNRLQSVTDAAGTTSYGYDAVGNRTSVSYPNGSSEVYQYDSLNRLTRKETYNGAGTLVQAYDYTLHATGRRTGIDELSGRSTRYSYDDLYRLTEETITDSQNGNYSASYQYDAVGNRTYSTIDGVQTAYSYDDNDRLTQQGGTRYSYDDNGNTLTETLDTTTTTYGYNAKNELVSVEQGGNTTEYAYNPNGIRISKTEGGATTNYVVDENRDYAQVLIEDDGTAQVSYTYGDDLISQDRGGEAYYYHYDGLGSTRSLTDSQGDLANTYDYEAFGELLGQTGGVENGYLFAGEQFDSTLDQYYLRARYYDPSQGRFTQQDTWMGNNHDPVTLHKYLYANADPGNMVDPSGNFSLGSLGAAINVNSILTTISVGQTAFDLLDFALNPESRELTAKEVGLSILLNYGGGKVAKLFSAKFRKLCNSFDGDTVVHTKDGLKPISELEIGDLVLSYNEDTKENEYHEVVHLIQNEQEYDFISIELNDGNVIDSTPSHPFFVDGEWINAQELERDDLLLFLGDRVSIDDIAVNTRDSKVYNLTVDGTHTYYVGESGVLVHNVGKDDACLAKITRVPSIVRKNITIQRCLKKGATGRCQTGWDHVLDRHFGRNAGGSRFTISPETLRYHLRSQLVVGAPVKSLGSNRFAREIVIPGKSIGKDKFNKNRKTNILTVIVNDSGELLSAFPGRL